MLGKQFGLRAILIVKSTLQGARSPCLAMNGAERAALSNNAQVITMGARVIGAELAKTIADAFLSNTFDEAGRSAGNVRAIDEVDAKYNR